MTEQEFWFLETQWEYTPEFQEYAAYCDKHKSSQTEKEFKECWNLFLKALDNEVGKKLRVEKMFWEIITK